VAGNHGRRTITRPPVLRAIERLPLLRRHLEEDLLAPHYREDMISVASVGHMLLADHAVLRPYLDELIALVRGERAS